ncbi:MAG: hypothetical protein V7L29_25395 [Nostoc sp.]|uniref:hypothetical protein n=1 Tax=Nostoc sp. TaxID=1180 RepID=UPI002FF557C7
MTGSQLKLGNPRIAAAFVFVPTVPLRGSKLSAASLLGEVLMPVLKSDAMHSQTGVRLAYEDTK